MNAVSILHLEDDDLDAELVQQRITGELPNARFTRVTDINSFQKKLERCEFDLLLCDYAGPHFDGASALKLAREMCPDIPFLYISGVLGEENAIESVKRGATDYVLKQRLERLNPAVRRALQEAESRRERQRAIAALASSEERARTSEERFQQLANAMPQIVWAARPDGYVDYYNERWYEFSGFARGQGGEASWTPIVHPDDLERTRQAWHASIRTGAPFKLEIRFFDRANNSYRWMLSRALPVRDGDGAITRWFGTCTDIDDQKRIAEALAVSEEQLTLALSAARMGTWRVDMKTLQMTCSDACKANHGRAPGDSFTYVDLAQSVLSEDRARWEKAVSDNVADGRDFDVEYRTRWPDGSVHWVLVRAGCMQDNAGKVSALMGVSLDITDRKRIEEERERLLATEHAARIEAERIGRMKDEFLATLSHELRTPLNAILGWAQVLERGKDRDPDAVNEAAAVIARNARSQAQLINDLLDMSRIVSGKLELQIEPVAPKEIIDAAMASIRHAAEARQIALSSEIVDGYKPILADPNRLQQVLWNLLINAVKFTPPGGAVRISMQRGESEIQIRVVDTGQGIEAELMPFIFERFRQGDSSSTRSHSGLGLGLALVKTLTELHGGSVRADSDGRGKGATFTITLPIAPVYQPYAHSAEDGELPSPSNGGSASSPPSALLGGRRILVVDDDRDARSLLQRLLTDCQASVTAVASACEGLQALKRERFDLIVSDIGMPDVDGYDFMRQVRAMPDGVQKTPAVALTAFARTEDRDRALAAGYQAHVPKPVDVSELVQVVAAAVGVETHR